MENAFQFIRDEFIKRSAGEEPKKGDTKHIPGTECRLQLAEINVGDFCGRSRLLRAMGMMAFRLIDQSDSDM